MTSVRGPTTAVLLSNGKVLAMSASTQQTELYDPATGTWKTTTGYLSTPRQGQTVTLLPNGKVLVSGGYSYGSLATAEVYDPATSTWSTTGSMSSPRYFPTATLLPNGKVLVTGGSNTAASSGITETAELYDPATGTWSTTSRMPAPRERPPVTLLSNGKVLVSGGVSASTAVATAELYTPGN